MYLQHCRMRLAGVCVYSCGVVAKESEYTDVLSALIPEDD
jgi:hypothetical protein